MSKIVKEIVESANTGQVAVEYVDDSTRVYNKADIAVYSYDVSGVVTGLVAPDGSAVSLVGSGSMEEVFTGTAGTVTFSGNGQLATPLNASVDISSTAGNSLTVNGDGLYVPTGVSSVSVADSFSVDLSGDGTAGTPLTAAVKLSSDAGNAISQTATGIFTPEASTVTATSTTVQFTGAGTAASNLSAAVKLSTDAGNTLSITPTGVFNPIPSVTSSASNNVTLSGAGTVASPLVATAVIDVAADNTLTSSATGLYVAPLTVYNSDTSTVDLSGVGSTGSPLVANVKLGSDAGNVLVEGTNGLFVPAPTISSSDSTSIDFSGTGASASPLTASVIVSANAGNTLTSVASGLYVPEPSILVSDSTSIDFSGDGTVASPLTASSIISPDAGNGLTSLANGLYSAAAGDTIQTANATGATTITAWNSVVLLPTLTGDITLNYPDDTNALGKTIKVIQTGAPPAFNITHTPFSGSINVTNAGGELLATGGAITLESVASGVIRQVSNSVAAATVTALTYGRVNASADLANISFSTVAPGTKVPFSATVYNSGTTFSGTDSIIPSQAGRYRVSWFMLAGSGLFNDDGIFHVVQNGTSLGSIFVDMMQAAGVNQISNFLDLDLAAGQAVELRYQPLTADSVAWGRGSYFDVTQLPTAVAPVVDTVAEYGMVSTITNAQVNATATYADVAGSSFTLPSAGTWELTTAISFANSTGGGTGNVVLTDSANTVVEGSRTVIGNGASTAGLVVKQSSTVFVTTTGAATYKLRFASGGANSTTIYNQAANNVGQSYITYKKVAGQLPSTGQSVDYVEVTRTSDIVVADNAAVQFDVISAGNIPYSAATGQFTLSAGKTYSLNANTSINGNTLGSSWGWYNVTAGAYFGNAGRNNADNAANGISTNQATAIFTPTVTTVVELRNTSSVSRNILGGVVGVSNGAAASGARIVQLGTSNITVTDNVALFGENVSMPTTQTTASGSFVDVTGSSFTLPSAGTWEVKYNVFTNNNTVGAGTGVQLANSAGVAVPSSFSTMAEANGGGTTGGNYNTSYITTTGAESYKLQWKVSGGTATLYNNATDASAGGSSKISWARVAGTSIPVTGQTVDFIEVGSAAGSNVPTLGNTANAPLLWGAVKSGNIAYNFATGQFTLLAGKTYKLEAEVAASTYIYWWNATTNATLTTNTAGQASAAFTGEAKTIFTPLVNTLVELRGGQPSYNAGNGNNILSTKANIVQLGNTATITTTRAVVQASHTTGQSIPNATSTALTGWTEQKDTTGAFNTATGVFTAPRTADYMVSFTCCYAGFTSAANGVVSAEITGAAAKGSYFPITNASVIDSVSPTLTSIVALTSGQAITMQTFQNTGAARALHTGANRIHLSIMEIEAAF